MRSRPPFCDACLLVRARQCHLSSTPVLARALQTLDLTSPDGLGCSSVRTSLVLPSSTVVWQTRCMTSYSTCSWSSTSVRLVPEFMTLALSSDNPKQLQSLLTWIRSPCQSRVRWWCNFVVRWIVRVSCRPCTKERPSCRGSVTPSTSSSSSRFKGGKTKTFGSIMKEVPVPNVSSSLIIAPPWPSVVFLIRCPFVSFMRTGSLECSSQQTLAWTLNSLRATFITNAYKPISHRVFGSSRAQLTAKQLLGLVIITVSHFEFTWLPPLRPENHQQLIGAFMRVLLWAVGGGGGVPSITDQQELRGVSALSIPHVARVAHLPRSTHERPCSSPGLAQCRCVRTIFGDCHNGLLSWSLTSLCQGARRVGAKLTVLCVLRRSAIAATSVSAVSRQGMRFCTHALHCSGPRCPLPMARIASRGGERSSLLPRWRSNGAQDVTRQVWHLD